MDIFLTGLSASLQVILVAIVLFMREKVKNAATIDDIRKITGEEQIGRLQIEAAKEVMASVARSTTSMEKMSIRMSLEALQKREVFAKAGFGLAIHKIWAELAGSLDRNYILLPQPARDEIDYFKDQWSHFLGSKEHPWVGRALSTGFIKSAALGVFRGRMSKHLDFSEVNGHRRPFELSEAKAEYSIPSLNKICGELDNALALNLLSCSLSVDEVKLLLPHQNFTFTDGEGKKTQLG